ncbi:pre-mRNA processing factor 31 isoform X2 [Brevipalpus obovatus]|uniref:pre-mRNA processing factor 31 isoform X2 n=1 Tax=Brevipalpus obovatus TaxID=246614 RepID=UPI003D9E2003
MSLVEELLNELDDVMEDETSSHAMEYGGINGSIGSCENSMDAPVSVHQLTKVSGSENFKRIMSEIEERARQGDLPLSKSATDGPLESHPEYQLIVEATNLIVGIEDDINIIYKFVKDKYSKRFPQLDSLVPAPLEYMIVIRELGNDLGEAKSCGALSNILTQATVMVINVIASTTKGVELTQDELDSVFQACDLAAQMNEQKQKITEFIESRMSFIAPNLSAIAGAKIAARIMGLAGGLTNLSRMPSCILEVLGSKKRTSIGLSSTVPTGFIHDCEIVQKVPPDIRRKAVRLVANKCSLAARIDASHSSPDGEEGERLKETIDKALEKLQEPPPTKAVKPLPPPIDQPKKQRGGKRVRKMKERLAATELRKQHNRMNFGEIEDDAYQDDLGFTTGQMGKSSMGRIRKPQIDEKTKARISKTLQRNLQRQVHGGTSTLHKQVAGTASSVAFTPLQGLEIVNPQAAESQKEGDSKYFSSSTGFASVLKRAF